MATYSNKRISNAINKLIDGIENLEDVVGEKLANVLKADSTRVLKKGKSPHGWPYTYHGSFKRNDVTYYDKENKQVVIDHPAANRLNFGQEQDPLIIKPKVAKKLAYMGNDGNKWISEYEKIPASSFPALGFAEEAIEDTKRIFEDKFSKGKLK